jgi:plastocyanin
VKANAALVGAFILAVSSAMHGITAPVRAALGGEVQSAAELHGTARVRDRAAVDAVVWLDASNPPPYDDDAPRPVLDQRNLTFVPHVLIVRVGSTVNFPNNDRVFHNVFSYRDGKRFDLGTYPVGALRQVVFDQPGLSRIFCNIHPGMAAYVMAVDTPYFAHADENGAFTIHNVPAGPHTYHAWRPGADEMRGAWASASGPLSLVWP